MLKFSSIFKMNGAHLIFKKRTFEKNKDCSLLSFVSNLEHINFALDGKYNPKTIMKIQTIMFPL
jgi:hypothetical protein